MGQFLWAVTDGLLMFFWVCIIASAVMSWLIAFNVMNDRHPFVRQVERFLNAVSRPFLWPVQKVIPSFGGVDISPVIVLLVLQAVRAYILPLIFVPLIRVLGS